MATKSILYVAYSPYENQGKVLDYIKENFNNIYIFTIVHHNVNRKTNVSKLTIIQNLQVIREIKLYQLYIPDTLVFILLPFRSVVNLVQILFYSFWLKNNYGRVDIFFSVNGFPAWIGNQLRSLNIVEKTIYWVCDYYPIKHKNIVISLMRWLYWQFEKKTITSNKVAFHNKRLVGVWKLQGVLIKNYRPLLIPIGTSKPKILIHRKPKQVRICFLGVLKKSHGLDYIFDAAPELKKHFPNIVIEIIGPGPDSNYFKKRARQSKLKCNFYGFINDKKVDQIISKSSIGIAPYMPDPSSVSFFGDPGKLKRYISHGLPVIATRIHEFSESVEKFDAGVLVEYGNVEELLGAIKKIEKNFSEMSKHALILSNKYYYKSIYKNMFNIK